MKSRNGYRIVLIGVALVLLLVLALTQAFAGDGLLGSSEEGVSSPDGLQAEPYLDPEVADPSFSDGSPGQLAGASEAAAGAQQAAPGADQASPALDPEVADPLYYEWNPGRPEVDSEENLYAAPQQPLRPGEEGALLPNPALATYFQRYTGAFFQPRNASSASYNYFGNGCISATANTYYVTEVQVPDGATIDFIRFYYYDAVTENATMYVTTYNGQGGYQDVVSVSSSGGGGYGSAGTSLNLPVDHIAESIMILYRPNVVSSSMALCGARIRYQYTPPTQLNLPAVLREN